MRWTSVHELCRRSISMVKINTNSSKIAKSTLYVGLSPFPVPCGNEGLGWDSLQKMVHNPGGHYWEGGTTQPFMRFVPTTDST